jgi:hypothetical protein
MIQRIVDDFRESVGSALRLTSLAAAAAIALFIATAFLCAAAFILVLERYGAVEACFAGAAIFFVLTLIAAGSYMVRKRQMRLRAQAAAKSAARNMLADPMVVTAGLQLVRTIGLKKLIPLLAIGGLALGLMANRNRAPDQAPAE